MPGHPAADLAALDVLLEQRRIFTGDHQAGTKFAFLLAQRHLATHHDAFTAARDVLIRSGGYEAVRAVIVYGKPPRPGRQTDRLQDGLDALHTHFQAGGML